MFQDHLYFCFQKNTYPILKKKNPLRLSIKITSYGLNSDIHLMGFCTKGEKIKAKQYIILP